METQNAPTYQDDRRGKRRDRSPLGGVVLIIIGFIFLLHRMDVGLPHWLFSWPMILIAVGTYIGAKQSFRFGGWIVPLLLGVAFLLEEEFVGYELRHYFWPIAIICIGLFMVLRPRRKNWEKEFISGPTQTDAGDYIDSSILFGGAKKNVITKNFMGGKVDNVFGGTDLNMMQSDFKGTIYIDFNVAFGGVKLLLPPQWNVRNEITAILGGIDDKRPLVPDVDQSRVLILRGSVMFGGVDIKSY